jgi:hypothetical protein
MCCGSVRSLVCSRLLGSVSDSPPSMGAIDKIVRRRARQIQVSSPNQQHLEVEVCLA